MNPANAFARFVPGFDFLQGLVKNAGAALPGMGQWIAPTLSPEEIDKRIEELRTVQFWLEQNARMLGATIQALEVQRMTLTTLKSMNVSLSELADAMKLPTGSPPPAPAPAPSAVRPSPEPAPAPAPPPPPEPTTSPEPQPATAQSAPSGVVDPMQWWGALTRQFTEITAAALKDNPPEGTARVPGAARSARAAPADTPRPTRQKAKPAAAPTAAAKRTSAPRAGTRPARKTSKR